MNFNKFRNTSVFATFVVGISIMTTGCASKPPAPIKKPVVKKYEVKNADTVGITGAAGELKRLTYGGAEELVSDLSDDSQWLLIDTYTIDNLKRRSKYIINKLNVSNSQKMILTPSNSSNSRAIWNKKNNKIIYQTDRSGRTIGESMGVNGETGIRFITNSSLGSASSPDLNEMGTDIVFTLNGNISMVKPDGTQIRMFGNGYSPKWSPNGKKVMFIRKTGNYRHIFIMNNNGTGLIQLTSETFNDYEAVWSPKGDKIAFISNRANKRNHLYIMDISGMNIIQLTDGQFNVSSLTWGKDGFIYFSADAGGNKDIWRLKPVIN